jgi:DNA-binding GntR family transcriptional regulator
MDDLNINFGQQPLSLKEMAMRSIKKAIFDGQLEPERIYSDMHLANTLGISKTPVREALIELASIGLLFHEPRKGFRIRKLSQKEVIDLFNYRKALELSILDIVVPRITDEEQHELDTILSTNKARISTDSEFNLSILADRYFHLKLAELSDNQFFQNAVKQVRDLCDMAGAWSLKDARRKYEAQQEHELILEMINAKDVEGAKNRMEEHLSITSQRIIGALQPSN